MNWRRSASSWRSCSPWSPSCSSSSYIGLTTWGQFVMPEGKNYLKHCIQDLIPKCGRFPFSALKEKIRSIFRLHISDDHGPGRVGSDSQTDIDSIQADPSGRGLLFVFFNLVVPMSTLFCLGSLQIWMNWHGGNPESKSSKYTVPARLCS